ncbi:hypothetical protein BRETT_000735 [Brettanomyces bruxellensis]|uniref:Uncharacterized protein n=1 Tax=Dekkera bruxellensis TaxID=5007 RepID=A0A871RB49_DEKBR|nr:uncharacterized protein BRETT_000735 [Brettanomyces bruxellensis]QOU21018.1 hypothetical protein BRETT_000735 [Brettanomyces bruxellensis]
MARAISRRSRAARRGEVDPDVEQDSQIQQLDSLPRAENTDVIGPMIRASLKKNQRLLDIKLEKKHHRNSKDVTETVVGGGIHKKKHTNMISRAVKSRRRRGVSVNGRLSKRIEETIKRRNQRRYLRSSDWDAVNKMAKDAVTKEDVDAAGKIPSKDRVDDEMDMDEVHEDKKNLSENLTDQIEEKKTKNMFDLLEEENS